MFKTMLISIQPPDDFGLRIELMVILENLNKPHSIIVDVFTEAVTQTFERKVWNIKVVVHDVCA